MSKPNHRLKLVNQLAGALRSELLCHRTPTSYVGDEHEFIKSKLRFRFTEEELQEVCLFFSSAVVDGAGSAFCNVFGKRLDVVSKVNYQPFLRGKGR